MEDSIGVRAGHRVRHLRTIAVIAMLVVGWSAVVAGSGAVGDESEERTDPTEPALTVPPTCLLGTPEDPAPVGGWPVFVLMHGYGTNKEDFSALVDEINRHGFAAVSVDAPDVIGPGRRSWGRSIDETHQYLQAQTAFLREDLRFNTERVHLGGFSQGGIRSLLLVAHFPEAYGGTFSLSPAGGDLPSTPKSGTGNHPLYLVYGTAENPGILNAAKAAKKFWGQWKQPLQTRTHPGGHHFPSDWVDVTEEAVQWIVRAAGSSTPSK